LLFPLLLHPSHANWVLSVTWVLFSVLLWWLSAATVLVCSHAFFL